MKPPESDHQLFERLRAGQEQAFVALYHRRQPALYRFALQMSGSAPVAEDITQEVFLALLRDECGYDPDRGSLIAYLFGIARKLLLRQFERRRSDVPVDAAGEEVGGLRNRWMLPIRWRTLPAANASKRCAGR